MLTPLAKPSTEVHRSQSLTLFKTGGGVVEHLKLFRLTSFYLQSYTRVAIRQFCQRQSRKTMLFLECHTPSLVRFKSREIQDAVMDYFRKEVVDHFMSFISAGSFDVSFSLLHIPNDVLPYTRAKQMYSSIKVKKIKAMIDQRNLFC